MHAEVFARRLGGALEGETSADQDDELIHEVGVFHHVRGADDGAAGVRQVAEQLHELEFRGRSRPERRFIEEEDGRLGEQLDADADALALAAGEPAIGLPARGSETELIHRLQEQLSISRGGVPARQAQPGAEAQRLVTVSSRCTISSCGTKPKDGRLVAGVDVLAIDEDARRRSARAARLSESSREDLPAPLGPMMPTKREAGNGE